jgi:hypothetical protein
VNTLVVCDAHDVSWLSAARASAAPDGQWDVLVLRVSAAAFERRHGDELTTLPGVRILDVATLAAAANRRVSAFVIDLIGEMPARDVGGRSLADLLQERDQNLWWWLVLSEKSSFRGGLIERLYRIALVDEALRASTYQRLWLGLGDGVLADVLARGAGVAEVRRLDRDDRDDRDGAAMDRPRAFAMSYWVRAAAALGRFAAVRLAATSAGWRAPPLRPGGVAIFTLFPYWWIEPFGDRPVERFFSAPPSAPPAHYLAWVTWPATVWRRRRELRATLSRAPLVPLQRFVRWRDAVRLLSPGRFRRLRAASSAVRRHLKVRFGAYDVSALVAADASASMAHSEVFFDHLVHAGVRGYLHTLRPETLVYRVECQPWESALLKAAEETRTPVAGFFHSTYGDNYPALRFAPGELTRAAHAAGTRPMPPGLLVSGATVEEYVVRDGYPRARVARCGPQRHAPFVAFLQSRPSRAVLRHRLALPAGVPIYFVAIAIVEVETEGLFACLEQALAGGAPCHLLVKTHPNRPGGDRSMHAAVASLGAGRVNAVPSGADMYEYLAASDAMICIGSTVAFEAIALDVMPVVYEHSGTFAATSLRAFGHALYVVHSPATMRAALEQVRQDAAPARARRETWPETLDGVFGDMRTPLAEQMARALRELRLATAGAGGARS